MQTVKPVNWSAYDKGGYLEETSKNYVMRAKLSRAHLDLLKDVELKAKKDAAKPLTKVYEALNVLSETPWKLNNKVYPVVLQAWESGGGIGELPPRQDMPYPPMPEEAATNWDVKKEYLRNYRKADKYNKEVHGLRCDMQLKLKVAEDFAKEPKFYFPHNMDFRGRAYPIPPHLNHIGAGENLPKLATKNICAV
jgi:DNA-directed RNA polymerase